MLRYSMLLVLTALLAACGGSGDTPSDQPVALTPEELAGTWQYSGIAEPGASQQSPDSAVAIAADGIITVVTAEILSDGFLLLRVSKGAPPQYTDTYTGYIALDGDTVSGRLNLRSYGIDEYGPVNLLGFGSVTGTTLGADSLSLMIENDARTIEVILERRTPDTGPLTDLDQFAGLWDDGLNANLDGPDFALEFDNAGLASGTWAGNCIATARLTPMQEPLARIELSAEGCPDAGDYVGIAEVGILFSDPESIKTQLHLSLLLGNELLTLPETYSLPGVTADELLGLWTQVIDADIPGSDTRRIDAQIHDGGIGNEGPDGRLRLRLTITTEDGNGGFVSSDDYFGELTLDSRTLTGRLNHILNSAPPGETSPQGLAQLQATALDADTIAITLLPATGRASNFTLIKAEPAAADSEDGFVDFAGMWALTEPERGFTGSAYSFDLTFPSDTGQGFGTLDGDCEFEVDLAHLGAHTRWEWARVRVLGCADNSPYSELTEWYGYALILAPFDPDRPFIVFHLGNAAETLYLQGIKPAI